ncbi:ATP-binding protein [Isoptericola nanjingensis]|uniref:ATP-binding protein n=1 Tax=Isoptericola nanjingensis TaxID=903413 RepID=UPI003D241439
MTGQRVHAAVLVAPAGERRRWRKARRRAAAQVVARERAARKAEAQARGDAERAERRATVVLPKAGERGPAALRTAGRLRIPQHQDTSATWGGAYPFLAEGGLGSDGMFVGQDLYSGSAFVFDPWVLYSRGLITAPNVVVAGIVGSGKSSLAKSLCTRSVPFGRRVYVPCDPKGEWTPVAAAVGGMTIRLGHGLPARLNPLDEGHRPGGVDDAEWAAQLTARRRDLLGALAETVLERRLSPLEHTAIDVGLTAAVRSAQVLTLPLVVDRLLSPDPGDDVDGRLVEDGRLPGHALRRLVAGDLAGMFDGPSTVRFDPTLPMVTLDLSAVAENSTAISLLMTCASAWMEAALADPDGGQRWVVYDEAWRLMSYPALLRRMDAHWRLARWYGIANMLVFHKLSDLENVGDAGSAMRALASSLLANAETRVIYRQESDQLGPTTAALGLSRTERSLLPTLSTGQGLWRIRERAFVVQHQLHPDEAALFDTSARLEGRPTTSRPLGGPGTPGRQPDGGGTI